MISEYFLSPHQMADAMQNIIIIIIITIIIISKDFPAYSSENSGKIIAMFDMKGNNRQHCIG